MMRILVYRFAIRATQAAGNVMQFQTRENWNHSYIFFGFPSQSLKLFNCHYRFLEKRLKETSLFSFFELWPTASVRDCLACFKHLSAVPDAILQVHPEFVAIL